MITASAITIPKAIPTMMNRLFILKIETPQIKTDAIELGKDME